MKNGGGYPLRISVRCIGGGLVALMSVRWLCHCWREIPLIARGSGAWERTYFFLIPDFLSLPGMLQSRHRKLPVARTGLADCRGRSDVFQGRVQRSRPVKAAGTYSQVGVWSAAERGPVTRLTAVLAKPLLPNKEYAGRHGGQGDGWALALFAPSIREAPRVVLTRTVLARSEVRDPEIPWELGARSAQGAVGQCWDDNSPDPRHRSLRRNSGVRPEMVVGACPGDRSRTGAWNQLKMERQFSTKKSSKENNEFSASAGKERATPPAINSVTAYPPLPSGNG